MDQVALDLNETIAAAVNARIEAEVFKALSGDETIAHFVAAALSQKVEVKNGTSYRTKEVSFLTKVLEDAIRDATQSAVRKLIADELPSIEDEVRKALRRDVKRIAEGLSQSLVDSVDKSYGVNVNLDLRMRDR